VSAKFTPGPWSFQKPQEISDCYGYFVIRASDKSAVAEVLAEDMTDEANVHLIVAAPEMYEALKVALMALTNEYYNKPRKGLEKEYEIVRSALAKAEGTGAE
jgi:hypothetical protein